MELSAQILATAEAMLDLLIPPSAMMAMPCIEFCDCLKAWLRFWMCVWMFSSDEESEKLFY